MRRALPIVSAVIPVLSERKKTGTGGGAAVTSARSPSSLTGHYLRRSAHPFIESALRRQVLRLYQLFDWYYSQPVGLNGETGHIRLRGSDRLCLGAPVEQLVGRPAVDHPIRIQSQILGSLAAIDLEFELSGRVGVRIDGEQASHVHR